LFDTDSDSAPEPEEKLKAVPTLFSEQKGNGMKKTIARILAGALLAVVLACGCSSEQPPVEEDKHKAPALSLPNYDGRQVSLSDYEGKIVVLEWFNFECPFVKYHYDTKTTMVDLARKYEGRNVVWLAVNSSHHISPEQNKDFAESRKVPYPILDDRPGKAGRAYGAVTTPHMFIVDTDGAVAYNGAIDNAPRGKLQAGEQLVNYVDKALAELLAGKPVSESKTKPYGCSVKYAE
jgi:peroxiredoxin